MRIVQLFWRLLAIFNYAILLPERFKLHDTESVKKQVEEKKRSGSHTPGHLQNTLKA